MDDNASMAKLNGKCAKPGIGRKTALFVMNELFTEQ